MVSKKTLYSNGATATKALYDDIFGGPPRFGPTTLSPRVEDYNEIFAGFHAPSRASSIPVLDLPVVHDDEEEVFFDVRSSLGFDYDEVFGGYTNGPEVALSFEELIMMESNGACHESEPSSDDVWIPADAEYLSEESDHSESNQCMSNGDSHESINGNMEFNISYHKASQSTNEDMINGVTGVTQLRAVPGYSFMVDNFTSLPKTDPPLEETDDGHLDIDFTGEMLTERHPRKTVSNPSNSSASGSLCRSDVSSSRGCVRNDTFPNESFITISDLSLRTQPSQLPPPSRPPPPLDVKMRDSGISTPNCGSASSEEKLGESSPPYFDVEVDASSSAAASAAAIKEAMEKAQAELKSAKELMDRKRDGFHSHIKSSSKNGRKSRDVSLTKDAHVYSRTKEERAQDYYQGEDNIEFSIAYERLNFANSVLPAPGSSEGEENVNMAAKSSEVNYRNESFSYQHSDKANGGAEWKYAAQFFELVQMDGSRTVFDSVSNSIVEQGQKEKKSTKVKAVRADYGLDEYPEKSKEAFVWAENNGRSEVAEVAHRQKRVEKVPLAQEVCRRDESDKELRINNHTAEYGKRQTRVEDLLQQGSMLEVQQSESTCGVKQTMKYKEKEQQTKANKTLEDQRSEMSHEEDFEQKEGEKKLEAASVYAQNERRVKEERKENDKRREERQKEARKREENERRLREALECEENERKLKLTREKEHTDRRLKDTLLKEEKERRQKEVLEQEDNSKREKEAHEREENEKRLKEALENENARRLREASQRQENERKNREAFEMEENEKRIHGNLKPEKIERQKEADEREGNEKRHRDSLQKEQNDERIIEEPETEGSGKQLRGVYEEEENGELHEGDGSETELTETCELEGVGDMSHDARNMEQSKLRHPYYNEGEGLDGINIVKEDYTLFSATCVLDNEKNLRPSRLAGTCHGNGEKQEATEENACGQVETKKTDLRENEKEEAFESANVQIYGKTGESNPVARGCFDHLQSQSPKENTTRETTCAYESVKKVSEPVLGIGHNDIDKIRVVPAMEYDTGNQGKKLAGGKRAQAFSNLSQSAFDQEGDRVKMMSNGIVRESIDSATKVDAAQPAVLQVNGTTQQVHESQSIERKVQSLKFNHSLEEKEAEKLKKQKLLEMERLRKMEEEREREREREKDRMDVDRAALEARERAYSESREKAERAAVERATAKARQRALNDARERLEKACAEAREKSIYDKPSIEARLRAERAAVERATTEARERAFEKAMADRAACEARVRIERSVSEKFSASSWNGGMRPSASSSELQDQQSQDSGSYQSVRSEGVEGDSAQRCKARLERHGRTAERAAKALAEKNMRDLLTQREQAERNRLAETLDADVKRWSSGKEGNLRALLSTLQYILGPDSGWHPVPLTEVITSAAVKRAYRKATLCVHPDKLQQRSATIQQKYVCEKVFDLLKEGWNKFNSEER